MASPCEGETMDTARRELVRHLFAEASAVLETAHEAAIGGQAPQASAAAYLSQGPFIWNIDDMRV